MRRCFLVLLCLTACGREVVHARSLHVVDGEVVRSEPIAGTAYENYVHARLALELDPPDLARAREHLDVALVYAPNDPHLWTMLAEIEVAAGDPASARAAIERALTIEPSYAPALTMQNQLRDGKMARRPTAYDERPTASTGGRRQAE